MMNQRTTDTRHLIDLGRGEPDFHTPAHVKQAAREAIEANYTKYTPQPGIPELRDAIARKFASGNGIHVSADEIVVSCGGKHSVELAIRALISPGDEVIIMTPHWFAYPKQVELAGGLPVLVPTREEDGFVPCVDRVKQSLTSRTRLIVLNTPGNPTGAVYPHDCLMSLADLALESDCHILSDEVYERFLFDGSKHVSIAGLDSEIARRVMTINSVSKTHAMTGWRIGYAALPGDLAERVIAIQEVSTSAPSAVSQRAALAALSGSQDHIGEMLQAYEARRAFVLDHLAGIPGISVFPPRGAFYCFVNISGLLQKDLHGRRAKDADSFVNLLCRGTGVQVSSGTPFGADKHIRISFARSMEDLQVGLDRVKQFLS
jgi:aspartate aminotransferase